MSDEMSVLSNTTAPLTQARIVDQLRAMGLAQGDLVLTHVSLSKLGWIVGGAQSVLSALLEVLGPEGTLAMPAFSSQLSDPTHWTSPPVPADWIATIHANMPLFDPDRTPTRGMGQVAEALRALPQTRRSDHPIDSLMAHGPLADRITADHPLSGSLGPGAPLGRLRDLGAKILLLGVGYDNCTAFHLAEYALQGVAQITERFPVAHENGVTRWQDVAQSPTFENHFPAIGAAWQTTHADQIALGFSANARLFAMPPAVAFARKWLEQAAKDGRLT